MYNIPVCLNISLNHVGNFYSFASKFPYPPYGGRKLETFETLDVKISLLVAALTRAENPWPGLPARLGETHKRIV